jgi:uncharacterized membrane protein
LSIQAVESLILLIAVLPIIKEVAQIRFHVISTKVDLYIAQFGFLVMSIGCLIMAFSQTLIVFILGKFTTPVCPSQTLTPSFQAYWSSHLAAARDQPSNLFSRI